MQNFSRDICALNNFAWGSLVVGWLKFGPDFSTFSAKTTFCSTPSTTGLQVIEPNLCTTKNKLEYGFSWTYTDPGDSQKSFQIQVDNDANPATRFQAPMIYDSGILDSSNNSYYLTDLLEFRVTYYWRVKVWDQSGNESEWTNGSPFATPLHSSPLAHFIYSPLNPMPDQAINFDGSGSESEVDIIRYYWRFTPNGNPPSLDTTQSDQANGITFPAAGTKTVTLEVTDSNVPSCTCSTSTNIIVGSKKSNWREIFPW